METVGARAGRGTAAGASAEAAKEGRVSARTAARNRPNILVIDPAGGLSGDMLLAGLFALGADARAVKRAVAGLPGIEPFTLTVERVKTRGIAANRVRVRCSPKARERNLAGILGMIDRSKLDPRVKELSRETFVLLGKAEAKVHGVAVDAVHFHEVGAVDSIVDIVGAAVALGMLGFPKLFHRPFRLGRGFVSTAHGVLPVPAPATAELLRGRRVRLTEETGEIVTPTGAALMRALAEELPENLAIVSKRVVYAAGTREAGPAPGLLRIFQAESVGVKRSLAVLRTTIDDMNPEHYGYIQERLFEAGALESYLTPLIMKKGRPGVLLVVLCEAESRERLLEILFRETTTLGVRVSYEEREELERWMEKVATRYGALQVKRARLRDGSVKTAPEYEVCRSAAMTSGDSISAVYEAARRAASERPTRTSRAAEPSGRAARARGGASRPKRRKRKER
jgi:uncharacterized protein (TIGR00299 family) protein